MKNAYEATRWILCLALALAGCDETQDLGGHDDAGADASMDAGSDAGADATPDAGTDAAPDAGSDAGPSFDVDLGRAIGLRVFQGTTEGASNDHDVPCYEGTDGPDLVFAWEAPFSGRFYYYVQGLEAPPYTFAITTLRASDGEVVSCGGYAPALDAVPVGVFHQGEHYLFILDTVFPQPNALPFRFIINGYPDALSPERPCSDGKDNDSDYLFDSDDPDCAGAISERNCSNGLDDDGDDLIDCADPSCVGIMGCPPYEICDNGIDDDGNGAIDCRDHFCGQYMTDCVETDCSNGLDDDGNSLIDCDDWSCTLAPNCMEDCALNGVDDDHDGATDCADSDCTCNDYCVMDTCPEHDLGSMIGDYDGTLVLARRGCRLDQPSCAPDSKNVALHFSSPRGAQATHKWTAPHAGRYRFSTVSAGLAQPFDAALFALERCHGSELACSDDDGPGLDASFELEVAAGESVILVIMDVSWYGYGPYRIRIDEL